ncbi:lysozyme inhibitor LprI family protein [Pseudomonas sp. NPDC088322]|uniref:lysozyme inhibitor LprI family protein n=1 Tax=Pseudomonas TaxID=286 RepID=UPI002159889B|nr:lysozyme inhibitor LprI family protein [Pseudomonas plecoglossicida]
MRNRTTIVMTLILGCSSAAASADDFSTSYTECMDKASSTVAMSSCIQSESSLQDQRLNRVYKQLQAKLAGDAQKALRTAQRSWIKYRDDNCALHSQASGGTLRQIEAGTCVMGMTRDRAAELERILSPGQ